ncbi:hypothetical protein [Gottfriedia acidiceleris]|uniref:hypothetical protein n=1 Tax=Gottfriedia acidiceleris TaxID=371036 RepID=UPI003000B6E4
MSSILEFMLEVILSTLTPTSSYSKKEREFKKKQKERMHQNINLLSNLPWFSTLMENANNKKLILKNTRIQGMLKNQPFVNLLLEEDEKCKKLFLRKIDDASKSKFKYF